jgi:SAM-dependent methyltransferase
LKASQQKDVWAAGLLYEPYIGRWSRLVAKELLTWLSLPVRKDWLDVGCGTGALVQIILEHGGPNSVTGVDPSPNFIEYAKTNFANAPVCFKVGDAESLPFNPVSFDAVVSGLVLNFIPQPRRAVSEMARVARLGATLAAYVWDYAGKMQLIRYFWDAALALDPGASEFDEGRRFPICHPDALADLFKDSGLADVEVCQINVPTHFRDFEDYWSPFLGGQGPAPSYAMSLSEKCRAALREQIRANLPIEVEGSIRLIARAWAVRGSVA